MATAPAAILGAALAFAMAGCSGEPNPAAAPQISSVTPTRAVSSVTPTRAVSQRSTPTPTGALRVVATAHLTRSVPVRLQIGAIGVDSGLMDLGLKADGTMEVPPGGFPAGWYTGAPTPGELGPAIITGHVDMKGPGVFYNLHKLKLGDQVTVTRRDGSKPVFRITRITQFPKDHFPTQQIYGNIDNAGLRLITCGGVFNSRTGHYEDNIVAFADLVAPSR